MFQGSRLCSRVRCALVSIMARVKLKAKGERHHGTLPGCKYPPLKVETPAKFDKAVEEYVAHEEKEGRGDKLTISGALLWMGIYDQGTLAAYAKRAGFAPSVKKLRAIIRACYEARMHSTQPTGAIFALKNMGWSDRISASLENPDGSPMKLTMEVVFVVPKKGDK